MHLRIRPALRSTPLLILAVAITSCAQTSEFGTQVAEFVRMGNLCSTGEAYAAGVNDAKNNEDMDTDFSLGCPSPEGLNASYREGYEYGLEHARRSTSVVTPGGVVAQECVTNFGEKVCGYNCKRAGTNVRCASSPEQQCVANDFGEIGCGYSCVATSQGVGCATRRRDTCAADAMGHVVCGRNCREEFVRVPSAPEK